jgi:hypothetical protein
MSATITRYFENQYGKVVPLLQVRTKGGSLSLTTNRDGKFIWVRGVSYHQFLEVKPEHLSTKLKEELDFKANLALQQAVGDLITYEDLNELESLEEV